MRELVRHEDEGEPVDRRNPADRQVHLPLQRCLIDLLQECLGRSVDLVRIVARQRHVGGCSRTAELLGFDPDPLLPTTAAVDRRLTLHAVDGAILAKIATYPDKRDRIHRPPIWAPARVLGVDLCRDLATDALTESVLTAK